MTMPIARISEMAEMVVVIFAQEPPPQRVIITNVLDHMACEGLLIDLDAVMNDTRNPERAGGLLQLVAHAMEAAVGIIRGRLGASVLSCCRLDLCIRKGTSLQKYVHLLIEVCRARRIHFAICARNLRVGAGDLHPAALSYHAYIAAISSVVQSVESFGNAQLTLDDAIHYNQVKRMDHFQPTRSSDDERSNCRVARSSTPSQQANTEYYRGSQRTH